MKFSKQIYYNGFDVEDSIVPTIDLYCLHNYCEPVSVCSLPNSVLIIFEYRGPVSKKLDTETKIPGENKYYYKCSKCNFSLVEPHMGVCPGCASHFVDELHEYLEEY